MPYTASTIGATATCSKALMDAIHPLTTAGGFTYVEEWTSGSNVSRIYKSPAASNVQNADWYLIVCRISDSDPKVNFAVAEEYNVGSHLVTKYMAAASSPYTPTAQYHINDPTGQNPGHWGASWQTQQIVSVMATAAKLPLPPSPARSGPKDRMNKEGVR
jgi:hypothetical protein